MNLTINKKRRIKKLIFIILSFSFVIQTLLIYTDNKGKLNKMSEEEFKGLNIWKKNNCQACHQIYGFGGFIGPDLTNKLKIYNEFQLENLLKSNIKQMPIIKLNKNDISYLHSFFKFIDKTGVSQLKIEKKNDKNIKWFEFK